MQQPLRAAIGRRDRGVLLAYGLLVLTMFFWSSNWVVGRAMHETVPPIALNFWRWTVASLLLLPFSWRQLRGKWPAIRRHWKILLGLGITGVGLFHALVYTGLSQTTAINALLLNSALPAIIICISWLWYRETINRRQFGGILVSFAGVMVIIAQGDPAALLHLTVNRGDLWIALALPVWGIYSVLLRRRPTDLGALAFLQIISLVGVASIAPLYAVETFRGAHMPVTLPVALGVVYVALGASLLSYVFWNYAVARIGANTAGFTVHLMPAFGTVMAIVFLGETVRSFQVIGIALILVGVFVSTASAARPAMSAG